MSDWQERLKSERYFWANWVSNGGDHFYRLNRPMAPEVREMLPEWNDQAEVLDVGSGVVSLLGAFVDGVTVKIVQADPLTEWYRTIAEPSPWESHTVKGEKLGDYFLPRKFDLVHSTNAIDHSEDPEQVLQEIGAVAKNAIYLEHIHNCALVNGWAGLHQWNFDQHNGRVVIWGKDRQFVDGMQKPIDVAEALGVKEWDYCFSKPHDQVLLRFRGWIHGRA